MRLPIRNLTSQPIRLFIEPECDNYEIPVGGGAVLKISNGPHSIDIREDEVIFWNNGNSFSTVEISSTSPTDIE